MPPQTTTLVRTPLRAVATCKQSVRVPLFIRLIVSTSRRPGMAKNRHRRGKTGQVYEVAENPFRRTAYVVQAARAGQKRPCKAAPCRHFPRPRRPMRPEIARRAVVLWCGGRGAIIARTRDGLAARCTERLQARPRGLRRERGIHNNKQSMKMKNDCPAGFAAAAAFRRGTNPVANKHSRPLARFAAAAAGGGGGGALGPAALAALALILALSLVQIRRRRTPSTLPPARRR